MMDVERQKAGKRNRRRAPDPYGDGYTHEALDRTYLLMETFETFVADSRCAKQFPDVRRQAEKVHQALFDLYQMIGAKWGPETE